MSASSELSSMESTQQKSSLLDKLRPPTPRALLNKLPVTVTKPIQHIPFPAQSVILKKVLKAAFSSSLDEGDMDFLQGKWLSIDITDTGIKWLFSCGPNREVLMRKNQQPDVTIRGSLKSFILLAAQKEDPDTLFFQRDLVIEGDTDLGLEIKNLLDSLDLDELPPELLFGIRTAAEFVTLF